jgi:hypothetical protein
VTLVSSYYQNNIMRLSQSEVSLYVHYVEPSDFYYDGSNVSIWFRVVTARGRTGRPYVCDPLMLAIWAQNTIIILGSQGKVIIRRKKWKKGGTLGCNILQTAQKVSRPMYLEECKDGSYLLPPATVFRHSTNSDDASSRPYVRVTVSGHLNGDQNVHILWS